MRAVIQRVSKASVKVDGKTSGEITRGICILISMTHTDTNAQMKAMATKCLNLRVFDSDDKCWKASVMDIHGGVLVVSQFTLYATAKKGTKPDFHLAMSSAAAVILYESFVATTRDLYQHGMVHTGVFGGNMQLELVNDGPVTIILET